MPSSTPSLHSYPPRSPAPAFLNFTHRCSASLLFPSGPFGSCLSAIHTSFLSSHAGLFGRASSSRSMEKHLAAQRSKSDGSPGSGSPLPDVPHGCFLPRLLCLLLPPLCLSDSLAFLDGFLFPAFLLSHTLHLLSCPLLLLFWLNAFLLVCPPLGLSASCHLSVCSDFVFAASSSCCLTASRLGSIGACIVSLCLLTPSFSLSARIVPSPVSLSPSFLLLRIHFRSLFFMPSYSFATWIYWSVCCLSS